jgi:hypothetical protein
MLALVPLAVAIFSWLAAPQAIGYVAADGSVFLKASGKGWLELTDWRADNGLNPLIIGDEIGKAPCMGKGSACWLDLPAGQFSVAPDMTDTLTDRSGEPCPTAAALVLAPNTGQQLVIHPCDYAGRGGAVIETDAGGPTIRTAEMQSGRAWTQPLYEKPARKRGQTQKP